MSIFSSIWGGIKNAFSGKSNAASASMSFPLLPGTSISGGGQSVMPNQTVAPTATDPGGTGYSYGGGSISVNSPAMQYNASQAANRASVAYPVGSSGTYTGGGSSSNSGTPNLGGFTTTAPRTISSRTLGATSGASSLSLGGTSTNQVSLPSSPSYSNVGAINNMGLVNSLSDSYTLDPATNTFALNTAQPNDLNKAAQDRNVLEQALQKLIPEKKSVYEDPQVQAQQEAVRVRQQEVNDATSRLNAIVAKQTQDLLSLRATGSQEGVTEAVYGGQAATINREAAIKALPVQAQVAAAQGNLKLAQDYLTELTTIKKDIIDADYTYRTDLYNSVADFVHGEQKIKLDELKTMNDRQYQESRDNLSQIDTYAKLAISENQGGLAEQIHRLNPYDPNFSANLGALVGQIQGGSSSSSPNSEYSLAKEYVIANPNISDEALKSDLMQNSDLSVSEINAIVAARTNKVTMDNAKVKQTAVTLIENSFEKKFFSNRDSELENTKDFVKNNLDSILGVLKIKDLTESDKERILQEVNNIKLNDISI